MRIKQPLPMKASKQYRLYSPSAMTNAYLAVMKSNSGIRKAARQFDVPVTTLRQRILGRVHPDTVSSGPDPTLTQEQEAVFVQHLKSMALMGYGYTRSEVVDMASNYAVFLKKRDKNHPFSLQWFRSFMDRWPELKIGKPRSLSTCRAKAASKESVRQYFQRLDEILTKYNLKDKPEAIYNVDEKGIQTEHTPPFVVSGERSTPAITSSRTAITTIIGCGNAIGTQIPPYFIFKGQRWNSDLLEDCADGSSGTVSSSGWSNSAVFLKYLDEHFLKYVQRPNKEQPIILIFDGHKSHVNVPLIQWAKQHNIVLFVLPAHTSHILQPLDIGCFGPLQRIYNAQCHSFIRENVASKITRYNVSSLASKAYINALSTANLKAAFKKSGIYPFDPSAIQSTQLAPAVVYNVQDRSFSATQDDPDDDDDTNPKPDIFFTSQSSFIHKKRMFESDKSEKLQLNISRVVSGAPITEPEVERKIKERSTQASESRPRKDNRKRKSDSQKQPKKAKQKKKTAIGQIDISKPGPSGKQVIPISDSESDTDTETTDNEVCCVCKLFRPKELQNCVSLVFTQWVKCDFPGCSHWTHLKYCCKETVVRTHTVFNCPCHRQEE